MRIACPLCARCMITSRPQSKAFVSPGPLLQIIVGRVQQATRRTAKAKRLYDLHRECSLSTHDSFANKHLEGTAGQSLRFAVGSGLSGRRKLSVVERLVGSLASAEGAGGIGSLGLRSEREGHT
jgi:hypothetical protein